MVKKWTNEELKVAIEMLDKGFTFREIGVNLNRNKDSIRKKLGRLGYSSMRKSNKEHMYKKGDIVNKTLKIIEQTRMRHGKYTQKAYIVQSLAYPKVENNYIVSESDLKKGNGDAYLCGKRICEENSLWSVKHIRPYIIDVEKAKKLPKNSDVPQKFKCDTCGRVKKMTSSNLIKRGIMCNICGAGTSYPELFFMSYNEVKKLGFSPQQTFDDFQGHIFDFVDYKNKIIVETHGEQHYYAGTGYMDYKKTSDSDKRKREYCQKKDWLLIELDCRKSQFEYIQKSIASEPILEDIKYEEIDEIVKNIEKNKKYPTKDIIKMYTVENKSCKVIGDFLNIDEGVVRNILSRSNVKRKDAGSYKKGKISPRRIILPEEEIIELYRSGKSTYKIGDKYNVSRTVISNVLKRNNVTLRPIGTNQFS